MDLRGRGRKEGRRVKRNEGEEGEDSTVLVSCTFIVHGPTYHHNILSKYALTPHHHIQYGMCDDVGEDGDLSLSLSLSRSLSRSVSLSLCTWATDEADDAATPG